MKKYIIEKTNHSCIGDISSGYSDRKISFRKDCMYAVVVASYYFETDHNKGYTTHKTQQGAIAKSKRLKKYKHKIIDSSGHYYEIAFKDGVEYLELIF